MPSRQSFNPAWESGVASYSISRGTMNQTTKRPTWIGGGNNNTQQTTRNDWKTDQDRAAAKTEPCAAKPPICALLPPRLLVSVVVDQGTPAGTHARIPQPNPCDSEMRSANRQHANTPTHQHTYTAA